MKKLRIALDWTANTNHTGFYVAQQEGFYKELGLEVTILTPDQDNYEITPAKKVELGQADFALCPFESVISYRTKQNPFDAVALATIFKEDISAIAVLASSEIKAPKDLEGKIYASYKARYEDEIVSQMIRNDGGNGNIEIAYPKKLGIWDTILEGQADATWIFSNWEGIQAKNEGVHLRLFKMSDYNIPYGYSPIIMASERLAREEWAAYSKFLLATKKGFLYAKENPVGAVKCLASFVSKRDQSINLLESQKFTANFYGTEDDWGMMDNQKVHLFIKWLCQHNLESEKLLTQDLIFKP